MSDDSPAPLVNTRNGFTKPLHSQQILSWVGYFLMIAGYFLFIFPSLYSTERAICTPIFCVFWLLFNCLFIRAELEKHRTAILPDDTKENAIKCRWCKRTVMQTAKHCRSCNLCRPDFDHHCFFLNNCVTNDNYNHFLFGIIFLYLTSLVESALSIYVIMGMAMKQENSERSMLANAEAFYGTKKKIPPAVWYVFHGLLLFMLLGIEYFITFLLGLHSCLIRKNITTYDVIMYRRMKDANEEAQKIAQNKKPPPKITIVPIKPQFSQPPPQELQPQLPEKDVSYSTSSKKKETEPQKQKEAKDESISSDSSSKGKSESIVEVPNEEKENSSSKKSEQNKEEISVSYSYSKSSSSPKKQEISPEPKEEEPLPEKQNEEEPKPEEKQKEEEQHKQEEKQKEEEPKPEEKQKEGEHKEEPKQEEEKSVSYSYSKSSISPKKQEISPEHKEEPKQKEEEHKEQKQEEEKSVSYSYSKESKKEENHEKEKKKHVKKHKEEKNKKDGSDSESYSYYSNEGSFSYYYYSDGEEKK